MIGELLEGHPVSDVKLKEVLGHTPLQVGQGSSTAAACFLGRAGGAGREQLSAQDDAVVVIIVCCQCCVRMGGGGGDVYAGAGEKDSSQHRLMMLSVAVWDHVLLRLGVVVI